MDVADELFAVDEIHSAPTTPRAAVARRIAETVSVTEGPTDRLGGEADSLGKFCDRHIFAEGIRGDYMFPHEEDSTTACDTVQHGATVDLPTREARMDTLAYDPHEDSWEGPECVECGDSRNEDTLYCDECWETL